QREESHGNRRWMGTWSISQIRHTWGFTWLQWYHDNIIFTCRTCYPSCTKSIQHDSLRRVDVADNQYIVK
ncbi:MAG: hypothetical protein ACYCOU_15590, partial [Sulfobacillus sp.]